MTDPHPESEHQQPGQEKPSRPEPGDAFEVCRIDSDPSQSHVPKKAVLVRLKQFGYGDKAVFAIKLALEEALANAMSHGNSGDCSKKITVRFSVDDQRAAIIVNDEGCGFMPDAVPDPTHPDRLSVPNGRGIMLMRAYTDEIEFRKNGCEVYFVKYKN